MVPTLSPKDLEERLKEDRIVLLDVREQNEVDFCHLPGYVHIPLRLVPLQASERLSKKDSIVVYCHHGVRSMFAVRALQNLGFEEVFNLAGGINAWSIEVDPTVPRY
jgi:rhodanese-related sulfurtransferase